MQVVWLTVVKTEQGIELIISFYRLKMQKQSKFMTLFAGTVSRPGS